MNYLFLASGFEEIEALTVIDVLRRAEIEVKMVSITDDLTVIGAHNIPVVADCLLKDVDFATAEYLILPGGMPGSTNLANCEQLTMHLKHHHEAQKPLAAICAAPLVFGRLGILKGVEAICYPGFEHELQGAHLSKQNVVQSQRVVTAKGPAYALEFALQLVKSIKGSEVADAIRQGMF
ncbi:MAG TPA: DJ-1/PfpI family protein [Paludibacteraceae bacterium]|jgi:4-methyl-5(b-hydroxyethyl)-thiazole monophosphate biosynthesis|nr:DJ-1/PfpI family protein [Paludibacteraceae bacterium]HQB68533.1 DJ-1/PfpI family protein [Paludibacteraceae bacterium]HRS67034.1 DJ-1/PfpI family protein [Paludibacteraceae bacterium]